MLRSFRLSDPLKFEFLITLLDQTRVHLQVTWYFSGGPEFICLVSFYTDTNAALTPDAICASNSHLPPLFWWASNLLLDACPWRLDAPAAEQQPSFFWTAFAATTLKTLMILSELLGFMFWRALQRCRKACHSVLVEFHHLPQELC